MWLDKHHTIATEYTERVDREKIARHTSQLAFNESKRVFEQIREIGGGYLDALSKYHYTTENILSEMLQCQTEYEKTQNLSDNEKERLFSFINDIYRSSQIVRCIQQDTINGVSNFKNDVLKGIKKATKDLHNDVKMQRLHLYRRFESPNPQRRVRYAEAAHLRRNLSNVIVDNDNDVELLIDAYYLRNEYGIANLCFVTFDNKHFFGQNDANRTDIEAILRGIYVQHPSYGPPQTQSD